MCTVCERLLRLLGLDFYPGICNFHTEREREMERERRTLVNDLYVINHSYSRYLRYK